MRIEWSKQISFKKIVSNNKKTKFMKFITELKSYKTYQQQNNKKEAP